MSKRKSLTSQVRRAYDQAELARVCTLREDRFGRAFGMQTVQVEPRYKLFSRSDRPEDYYHYRDNGSSVLAVAHLDTVVSQQGRTPYFRDTKNGPAIVSGALDDRLGAYVILELLPKLGLTCDWLLTVGEESGASTAEYFSSNGKKYDWIIEFDRGGTDVVMYQYEDAASVRLVEAAGPEVGWGSFSDIAYLEQLNVKAFNWGVGYRGNYHSEDGYAFLNDTFAMVAKYLRFHEQNAGTPMPHDKDDFGRGRSGSGYSGKWDDYSDCAFCGEKDVVDSVTWYCTYCGLCQDCGGVDPDVVAQRGDPDEDACQCYAPKRLRDEAADVRSQVISVTAASASRERDDWTGITWEQYLAQRPGPDSPDDDVCGDCGKDAVDECACDEDAADDDLEAAHEDAQRVDGPGTLVKSLAPSWSPSYGLGIPTSRKTAPSSKIRGGEAGLRKDIQQSASPSAADWHAAANEGTDGLYVVAHVPGPGWARVCLRCAARWPHPIAGTDGGAEIHPESECPGCTRCRGVKAEARIATGAIHVIPAHVQGDSDVCPKCREWSRALTAADR